MSFLRDYLIDEVCRFSVITSDPTANSAATDATGNVVYRVYEDGTYMSSPAQTGNMTLTDSANTDGFYSATLTLSAANGYEASKNYTIHIAATVGGVAVATSYDFRIVAAGSTPPSAASIADAVCDEALAGHTTAGTVGKAISDILDDTGTSGVVLAADSVNATSVDSDVMLADADWQQVRYRLGVDGTSAAPSTANPNLGQVTCQKITVTASGNDNAVTLAGAGTGAGLHATGGSTGQGARIAGGANGGDGLEVLAQAATYSGLKATGVGTGPGISASGGASGSGAKFLGGASGGHGLEAEGQNADSAGILAQGETTGPGIRALGGTSGSGIIAQGSTSGHGLATMGGSTGDGVFARGGASAGRGILAKAQAGNYAGIRAEGSGTSGGLSAVGGTTGPGFEATGGAASGAGAVFAAAGGNSDGLTLTNQGTGKPLTGIVEADLLKIGADPAAATILKYSTKLMGVYQVAATPTPTATTFKITLVAGALPTSDIADWNRRLFFVNSGTLGDQQRRVNAFTDATDIVSCEAFSAAPSPGDYCVLI